MALVKAPNGDVYDLSDAVASGLVNSKGSGFSRVEDEPEKKAPAKKPAAKK